MPKVSAAVQDVETFFATADDLEVILHVNEVDPNWERGRRYPTLAVMDIDRLLTPLQRERRDLGYLTRGPSFGVNVLTAVGSRFDFGTRSRVQRKRPGQKRCGPRGTDAWP
jgi:hypothetical protein